MGQSYNALSVDHSIEADKDGSTVTLLDIMGQQDDNYDLTEKRMILERILPILSDRERQIIQCTFIEGLSQKETGERIGLSQMHVSRLQRTAIKKLQEAKTIKRSSLTELMNFLYVRILTLKRLKHSKLYLGRI